jgi:hypothetical protein
MLSMSGEYAATNGLQSVSEKNRTAYSFGSTRILRAPDLKDDYYLKLTSWRQDILVVALTAKSANLLNMSTRESSFG